ncbi:MAG: hypothetical protein JJ896_04905 [Rhodothermales bacterium]|nr:hypothetical protein [Rhodothermales bacterium]MBO6778972.1 hypothetical protein [Rhodothermales bacterium]
MLLTAMHPGDGQAAGGHDVQQAEWAGRHAAPDDSSAAAAMLLTAPQSLELLQQGRHQLLAGYLEGAESTFRTLMRRPDGLPAALHHLATVSLVRVLLYDRPEDYEAFFSRSDSLRDGLADAPRGLGRQFLSGESDFQRSMAWAKQGGYVRAAMAGVSAYRSLSELREDYSGFREADKSLGIVHATLGTLPRRYRRFLAIFGFETEIEAGLDQLVSAVEESAWGREESLLYMAILDSFELPSRIDGVVALEQLRAEYEGSPLIALVVIDALMRSRRVAQAERVLNEVEQPRPGQIDLDYLEYFRAEAALRNERWEEAARRYAAYRARHDGTAFMAVAALRQGVALEMDGRRQRAEMAYRQVAATRDFDSDEASAREARRRLAAPMLETERDLFRARMAHDRGAYGIADSVLTTLRGRLESDELQAEWAYRYGRTLDESGQDGPAFDHYAMAVHRPGDPQAKWAPYGLYYQGRIMEDAGRFAQARELYQQVVDYSGSYDYRGTNEQRARFALRRLEGTGS